MVRLSNVTLLHEPGFSDTQTWFSLQRGWANKSQVVPVPETYSSPVTHVNCSRWRPGYKFMYVCDLLLTLPRVTQRTRCSVTQGFRNEPWWRVGGKRKGHLPRTEQKERVAGGGKTTALGQIKEGALLVDSTGDSWPLFFLVFINLTHSY